jgi:hypothetical protein
MQAFRPCPSGIILEESGLKTLRTMSHAAKKIKIIPLPESPA